MAFDFGSFEKLFFLFPYEEDPSSVRERPSAQVFVLYFFSAEGFLGESPAWASGPTLFGQARSFFPKEIYFMRLRALFDQLF